MLALNGALTQFQVLMSYTFGSKFPNYFIDPAFLSFVETQGYVSTRIDKPEVLKAISWNGTVYLDFKGFLKSDKTLFYESVVSNTIVALDTYIATPVSTYISIFEEDPDLNIAINTKIGNVQFLNPDLTVIEHTVNNGIPNYKIYFEYTDSSKSDKPSDRIALHIASSKFKTFVYVLEACPQKYSEKNKEEVIKIFFRELNTAGTDGDRLDELYELAPQYAIDARDEDLLWRDLTLLSTKNVDSWGTDEEKAVLKILAALSSEEKFADIRDPQISGRILGNPKADLFLQKLFAIKPLQKTLFELLYDKMNNFGGEDNFTALMQRLYLVWIQSSYLFAEARTLDYSSEKTLGFYQTSHDFKLEDGGKKIVVSENSFTDTVLSFILGVRSTKESGQVFGSLDRVSLINTAQVKIYDDNYELMPIPEIMPAFFLKGLDDDVAAKNLETGIMLAIDILTTFTGFGNVFKFKRLLALIKAVNEVSKGTRILAAIKIGVTGFEIASGSLSIMITLADADESKFGQKLRSFLFWVDMATLSADAVTSRLLKKSAQESLELAKKSKVPANVTEEEFNELIQNLENIAGPTYKISSDLARLNAYKKWRHKFDKNLVNHLTGDVGIKIVTENGQQVYKLTNKGQGGHLYTPRFIEIKEFQIPPGVNNINNVPIDTPFKCKINIKSKYGKVFVKSAPSSIFPKNWDIKRVREEIAWVYENSVAKGRGLNPDSVTKKFKQYKSKNGNGNFDILIEVDDDLNIINAYPLI